MKNILFLILFTIGISPGIVSAQDYVPDLSISLEDFEKQALSPKEEIWVVDFWASWCRPCIHSIPHMKQLHQKYANKGVRFISISWDRNEVQWAHALEQFRMPWNHIWVSREQAFWLDENFPHKGIPTVFVVSREGKSKKVNDVQKLDKTIYKAL